MPVPPEPSATEPEKEAGSVAEVYEDELAGVVTDAIEGDVLFNVKDISVPV